MKTDRDQQRQLLAEQLSCEPKKIRPCFLIAWFYDAHNYAQNRKLSYEARGFVGLEVMTICPFPKRAQAALRAWGKEKGFVASEMAPLLAWTASHDFSQRGCNHAPLPKAFCVGKEHCPWYKAACWKETDRSQSDLKTLYGRGWAEVLRGEEVELYRAMIQFETENKLVPGSLLYFSKEAARQRTGMRGTKQRRVLEALEAIGLIKVIAWGAPRTAGAKVETRTIRRVVPIPFIPQTYTTTGTTVPEQAA